MTEADASPGTIRLVEMWIYPVKGCRGVSIARGRLGSKGLAGDREWMVVDGDGRFVSQRTHPRLALVAPHVADGTLTLAAPDRRDLALDPARLEPRPPVTVWRDTVDAVSAGAEARRWLESWLGMACDLVRMAPGARRPVDPRYAEARDEVSFADAFPVLLISQASLDDLNRRLAEPLRMNRFRPNLVVDGCRAFAEDSWRALEVGAARLRVVKPCARCSVTTVDQETGERGIEPLTTLATYRSRDGKVMFGQNLVPDRLGTLRVGEAVRPEEHDPPNNPSQDRRTGQEDPTRP